MATFEEQQIEEEIKNVKDAFENKDSIAYKYGLGFVEGDVKLAKNLFNIVRILKFVLALLVGLSYFYFQNWLIEIIALAVIISLIFPLGFFQNFIQSLLEYNIQITRVRV